MAPNGEASVAFASDTVVVITGCSRGLGFNLAKGILETTASNVVATARNVDKATALRELEAKYSGRVHLVNLDTESEDSIKVCTRAMLMLRIVFVHCAGFRCLLLRMVVAVICCCCLKFILQVAACCCFCTSSLLRHIVTARCVITACYQCTLVLHALPAVPKLMSFAAVHGCHSQYRATWHALPQACSDNQFEGCQLLINFTVSLSVILLHNVGSALCVQAAAADVSKKFDGIDLLFNNAGIDEGVDKSCLEM